MTAATSRDVRTTCPYCGVGCGVRRARRTARSRGDPDHPANRGRLCSKGAALGETLAPTATGCCGRSIGGARRVAGTTALDLVAGAFRETIARARAGRGRLLRLRPVPHRGLLRRQQADEGLHRLRPISTPIRGSAWPRRSPAISAPSARTSCPASMRIWSRPISSCWSAAMPPGAIRSCSSGSLAARAAARHARSSSIDPRRTATAEIADLHLPLAPGTRRRLFAGLLVHLARRGARRSPTGSRRHASGLRRRRWRPPQRRTPIRSAVAAIARSRIQRHRDLLRSVRRDRARGDASIRKGVNQSASGTDKVNAIINCHLATGRIGRPGMGPFSRHRPAQRDGRARGRRPRQPARRAYGLRHPPSIDRVRRFWNAPDMATRPGLKAVDLFDAVRDGRIKALWIMATNPAASMPRAERVRAGAWPPARSSSSPIAGRPTRRARRMSCCRPRAGARRTGRSPIPSGASRASARFRAAPGEARPDWWMLARGGAAAWAGRDAFAYRRPGRRSFASMRRFPASRTMAAAIFDIGALAGLSEAALCRCSSRCMAACRQRADEDGRFFAEGGFFTPDGKARFVATPFRPTARRRSRRHPFLAQHRPHPRPVAHHDPHRPCAAPDGASGRTLS